MVAPGRKRRRDSLSEAERRAWHGRRAAEERARKLTSEELDRAREKLIADMERFGRERPRPDKWRRKFRKTMDAAITAFEDGSPLKRRDTWLVTCLLTAARDAYSPDRKPERPPARYRPADRRARSLAERGKTTAEIVAALTAPGAELCGSERTAYRYAKKVRKS